MLSNAALIAFLPARELARTRTFVVETLGLPVVEEDSYGFTVNANGTSLRVAHVPTHESAAFTILGWKVPTLEQAVTQLEARGLRFLRYSGMQQDAHGIWQSPSGARVAWFKDPDGNVLSLTED